MNERYFCINVSQITVTSEYGYNSSCKLVLLLQNEDLSFAIKQKNRMVSIPLTSSSSSNDYTLTENIQCEFLLVSKSSLNEIVLSFAAMYTQGRKNKPYIEQLSTDYFSNTYYSNTFELCLSDVMYLKLETVNDRMHSGHANDESKCHLLPKSISIKVIATEFSKSAVESSYQFKNVADILASLRSQKTSIVSLSSVASLRTLAGLMPHFSIDQAYNNNKLTHGENRCSRNQHSHGSKKSSGGAAAETQLNNLHKQLIDGAARMADKASPELFDIENSVTYQLRNENGLINLPFCRNVDEVFVLLQKEQVFDLEKFKMGTDTSINNLLNRFHKLCYKYLNTLAASTDIMSSQTRGRTCQSLYFENRDMFYFAYTKIIKLAFYVTCTLSEIKQKAQQYAEECLSTCILDNSNVTTELFKLVKYDTNDNRPGFFGMIGAKYFIRDGWLFVVPLDSETKHQYDAEIIGTELYNKYLTYYMYQILKKMSNKMRSPFYLYKKKISSLNDQKLYESLLNTIEFRSYVSSLRNVKSCFVHKLSLAFSVQYKGLTCYMFEPVYSLNLRKNLTSSYISDIESKYNREVQALRSISQNIIYGQKHLSLVENSLVGKVKYGDPFSFFKTLNDPFTRYFISISNCKVTPRNLRFLVLEHQHLDKRFKLSLDIKLSNNQTRYSIAKGQLCEEVFRFFALDFNMSNEWNNDHHNNSKLFANVTGNALNSLYQQVKTSKANNNDRRSANSSNQYNENSNHLNQDMTHRHQHSHRNTALHITRPCDPASNERTKDVLHLTHERTIIKAISSGIQNRIEHLGTFINNKVICPFDIYEFTELLKQYDLHDCMNCIIVISDHIVCDRVKTLAHSYHVFLLIKNIYNSILNDLSSNVVDTQKITLDTVYLYPELISTLPKKIASYLLSVNHFVKLSDTQYIDPQNDFPTVELKFPVSLPLLIVMNLHKLVLYKSKVHEDFVTTYVFNLVPETSVNYNELFKNLRALLYLEYGLLSVDLKDKSYTTQAKGLQNNSKSITFLDKQYNDESMAVIHFKSNVLSTYNCLDIHNITIKRLYNLQCPVLSEKCQNKYYEGLYIKDVLLFLTSAILKVDFEQLIKLSIFFPGKVSSYQIPRIKFIIPSSILFDQKKHYMFSLLARLNLFSISTKLYTRQLKRRIGLIIRSDAFLIYRFILRKRYSCLAFFDLKDKIEAIEDKLIASIIQNNLPKLTNKILRLVNKLNSCRIDQFFCSEQIFTYSINKGYINLFTLEYAQLYKEILLSEDFMHFRLHKNQNSNYIVEIGQSITTMLKLLPDLQYYILDIASKLFLMVKSFSKSIEYAILSLITIIVNSYKFSNKLLYRKLTDMINFSNSHKSSKIEIFAAAQYNSELTARGFLFGLISINAKALFSSIQSNNKLQYSTLDQIFKPHFKIFKDLEPKPNLSYHSFFIAYLLSLSVKSAMFMPWDSLKFFCHLYNYPPEDYTSGIAINKTSKPHGDMTFTKEDIDKEASVFKDSSEANTIRRNTDYKSQVKPFTIIVEDVQGDRKMLAVGMMNKISTKDNNGKGNVNKSRLSGEHRSNEDGRSNDDDNVEVDDKKSDNLLDELTFSSQNSFGSSGSDDMDAGISTNSVIDELDKYFNDDAGNYNWTTIGNYGNLSSFDNLLKRQFSDGIKLMNSGTTKNPEDVSAGINLIKPRQRSLSLSRLSGAKSLEAKSGDGTNRRTDSKLNRKGLRRSIGEDNLLDGLSNIFDESHEDLHHQEFTESFGLSSITSAEYGKAESLQNNDLTAQQKKNSLGKHSFEQRHSRSESKKKTAELTPLRYKAKKEKHDTTSVYLTESDKLVTNEFGVIIEPSGIQNKLKVNSTIIDEKKGRDQNSGNKPESRPGRIRQSLGNTRKTFRRIRNSLKTLLKNDHTNTKKFTLSTTDPSRSLFLAEDMSDHNSADTDESGDIKATEVNDHKNSDSSDLAIDHADLINSYDASFPDADSLTANLSYPEEGNESKNDTTANKLVRSNGIETLLEATEEDKPNRKASNALLVTDSEHNDEVKVGNDTNNTNLIRAESRNPTVARSGTNSRDNFSNTPSNSLSRLLSSSRTMSGDGLKSQPTKLMSMSSIRLNSDEQINELEQKDTDKLIKKHAYRLKSADESSDSSIVMASPSSSSTSHNDVDNLTNSDTDDESSVTESAASAVSLRRGRQSTLIGSNGVTIVKSKKHMSMNLRNMLSSSNNNLIKSPVDDKKSSENVNITKICCKSGLDAIGYTTLNYKSTVSSFNKVAASNSNSEVSSPSSVKVHSGASNCSLSLNRQPHEPKCVTINHVPLSDNATEQCSSELSDNNTASQCITVEVNSLKEKTDNLADLILESSQFINFISHTRRKHFSNQKLYSSLNQFSLTDDSVYSYNDELELDDNAAICYDNFYIDSLVFAETNFIESRTNKLSDDVINDSSAGSDNAESHVASPTNEFATSSYNTEKVSAQYELDMKLNIEKREFLRDLGFELSADNYTKLHSSKVSPESSVKSTDLHDLSFTLNSNKGSNVSQNNKTTLASYSIQSESILSEDEVLDHFKYIAQLYAFTFVNSINTITEVYRAQSLALFAIYAYYGYNKAFSEVKITSVKCLILALKRLFVQQTNYSTKQSNVASTLSLAEDSNNKENSSSRAFPIASETFLQRENLITLTCHLAEIMGHCSCSIDIYASLLVAAQRKHEKGYYSIKVNVISQDKLATRLILENSARGSDYTFLDFWQKQAQCSRYTDHILREIQMLSEIVMKSQSLSFYKNSFSIIDLKKNTSYVTNNQLNDEFLELDKSPIDMFLAGSSSYCLKLVEILVLSRLMQETKPNVMNIVLYESKIALSSYIPYLKNCLTSIVFTTINFQELYHLFPETHKTFVKFHKHLLSQTARSIISQINEYEKDKNKYTLMKSKFIDNEADELFFANFVLRYPRLISKTWLFLGDAYEGAVPIFRSGPCSSFIEACSLSTPRIDYLNELNEGSKIDLANTTLSGILSNIDYLFSRYFTLAIYEIDSIGRLMQKFMEQVHVNHNSPVYKNKSIFELYFAFNPSLLTPFLDVIISLIYHNTNLTAMGNSFVVNNFFQIDKMISNSKGLQSDLYSVLSSLRT